MTTPNPPQRRGPPLALIADNLSNDVTECCKQLLKEARAGRLIGLAFIGVVENLGYIADTAGEAHRSPTWTRGALKALDDKLAERVRGGENSSP